MRRAIIFAAVACATACADILGVRDFTYVEDASLGDGDATTTGDAALDATPFDAGAETSIIDSGPCILCVGTVMTPCAMSCMEKSPQYLTSDATRLYWANSNGNGTYVLRTIERAMPGTAKNITTQAPNTNALAAHGGQVFWTDGTNVRGAFVDGGTRLLAVSSGARSVHGPPPQGAPARIFWLTSGMDAGLRTCVLPDCTTQLLQVANLADPVGLEISNNNNTPFGLWIELGRSPRELNGANAVGGYTLTKYVSDARLTLVASEDVSSVYYTIFSGGVTDVHKVGMLPALYSVPGTITAMTANLGAGNLWIAVDDPSGGSIVKLPSKTVLVANAVHPQGIEVDGSFVYWSRPDGRIMRAGR